MVECKWDGVESREQEQCWNAEAGRLPNVIWNERSVGLSV